MRHLGRRTSLPSLSAMLELAAQRKRCAYKNERVSLVSPENYGMDGHDVCMVQEGLRVGQKLVAISSPMQSGSSGEMWDINEKPSLRFVRDAIRMRRTGSIILELTSEPVLQDLDQISEDLPQSSLLESMNDGTCLCQAGRSCCPPGYLCYPMLALLQMPMRGRSEKNLLKLRGRMRPRLQGNPRLSAEQTVRLSASTHMCMQP